MDILILSTEAIGIGGRQHLNIRHCGNEYVVSLFAEGFRAKSCHRHFSSIDDALLKYNEIVSYMVKGEYSLNQRIELLNA